MEEMGREETVGWLMADHIYQSVDNDQRHIMHMTNQKSIESLTIPIACGDGQ